MSRSLDRRPDPTDLTIAICTIGRDEYLQAAIESLLATTPSGVTMHVVFNGCDDRALIDDTTRLLEQWDGPNRITELSERTDIASSHNTALDATETDFVQFMGDDDLALEPRVERLLDLFWTTDPTPAVVSSYCRRVSGTAAEPAFSSNKDYGPDSVGSWLEHRAAGQLIEVVFPAAIYRTEDLRSIGGFGVQFGSAIDIASFMRLGIEKPVIADTRRSFAHRVHDGSVTSTSSEEHARRVRYVLACAAAWRDSTPEPSWSAFMEQDAARPRHLAVRDRRRTTSAALFRQGGAAIASGHRLRGTAKMIGAASLSPGTLLTRTRAQVTPAVSGDRVVSVLIKNLNLYRVPFFELVREQLADRDVELRLITGTGLSEDAAKGDRARLPWAEVRPVKAFDVRGTQLLWQPGFDVALASDLVITEQATKQLFNIALSYGQRLLGTAHAFWGHGRNFQASIEGDRGEALKRRLTRRARWFFAYNNVSAASVAEFGFPADRTTILMNATDTTHIRSVRERLPPSTADAVRTELGMGSGPVALYLGGIYEPKRPDFLIAAAEEIRRMLPDFELLVIGDGSSGEVVRNAAARHGWIHHVGAAYGDERIRLASVASLQLMPGLVGLNIVDGFALGLPTITVDLDYHSPEIEYLEPGENGEIAPSGSSPAEFAEMVVEVLNDRSRLDALVAGAEASGKLLSIEDMASRFTEGVVAALELDER